MAAHYDTPEPLALREEDRPDTGIDWDFDPGYLCARCFDAFTLPKLRTLADVTCPHCGAGYADIGINREP